MRRLWAMIVKEWWALVRDPRARLVLVAPPLIQLFVFAFATTLDVTNVAVGVLDRSSGVHSSEFVARREGSPNFREVRRLRSIAELRTAIDRQEVIAAVVIDGDFARRLERGERVQIGVVLDGRRSNASQIVGGYLQQIAGTMGAELLPGAARAPPSGSVVTNWYNPALDYMWFTIPALVAIISSVSGLAITSQSVAREREVGTFDQLMASPVRVHEILIGKMVPPLLIGFLNGGIYLLLGPLIFGVPVTGSVAMFFVALFVFLLALIGVGLAISAASQTQQQAFLGTFLVMTPLILLSGYASPIDNMPEWMQVVTYANPVRYFLIIVQGLFLKDMSVATVLAQTWPMAVIGCATLATAAWLFRARME